MIVSVPSLLNVDEGQGTVQVCARLSVLVATERDVVIMLAISNGTGKAAQAAHVICSICSFIID